MKYAKVVNGVLEKYPYSLNDLKRDNPRSSFPVNHPENIDLAAYNVVKVVKVDPPLFDTETHHLTEGTPALNGNMWGQTWSLVPKTQQELGDQQAAADALEDEQLTKADALLTQMQGLRPAQIENFIDNNFAGHTVQQRKFFKMIGKTVALLSRRL